MFSAPHIGTKNVQLLITVSFLRRVVQSHRNLQCLMGSGKGEFCHRFCLIYMDDLSVNLKECPTGCIAGGTIVNHLMYADDIVLLS